MEEQFQLFNLTADSPKGGTTKAEPDQSTFAKYVLPKGWDKRKEALAAITMEEIADSNNLREAFRRVKANKGAPGHDGKTVAEVEATLDKIIPKVTVALLNGSYRPGLIRRVWIPKSGGGKRGLGIPAVVDRMVMQATSQIMSPHYEPGFHPSSHGFRPGKSCHTAIAEAKTHVEDGYEYVVDIDLEKYFDRVNHQRLLSKLQKKITDKRVIKLIQNMLKASVVMPEGVVVTNDEGVPQGGPLSPLLSNIVLDELDWELHRRGHKFVRYADDQNIYVRSERAGHRVMESVRQFLEKRLKLKINTAKSAVAKSGERHFLGFRLERSPFNGNVLTRLSKRSVTRIYGEIRNQTPRNWGQSLDRCIYRLNEYLEGWVEFFKICSKRERITFEYIDSHIRRRLRALKLRQWKRKRFIARRLIGLKAPKKTAWRKVYKGKQSLWALSHNSAVEQGLRNEYFAERGLVSVAERWKKLYLQSIAIVPVQLSLDLE